MKNPDNILDLIGNTPLLPLKKINKTSARILVKVEAFNPSGSIKDRAAKAMIEKAIDQGKLTAQTLIIEPTSGNTGIALAMIAAYLGNRLLLTMPDNLSAERRTLLRAYGADLVLTPAAGGMAGAIAEAERLLQEYPNSYMPAQFDNPANVAAHHQTTGPEIWEATAGKTDILISAVGSGGTVTGCGKYLKEKNPRLAIIAVEPENSPVLSKGYSGVHKIQGIGAGFVPKILDRRLLDEILTVGDDEAIKRAKQLAKIEGIYAGISSGAAVQAALTVGARPENAGKTIVVILPDSGDRYLSVYQEEDNG